SILIFLFVMEPLITLVIICLSGLGAGTFILLNKKKMKEYGAEEQMRRAEMIKALNQGLGGIKDARVLNREEEFINKFRREAFENPKVENYIQVIQESPRPVGGNTGWLGNPLGAVIIVLEGRLKGGINPLLAPFAMATVRLKASIQQVASKYTKIRYNMVS